uniref:Hypothetical secreted protein n=1 Tax=Triatoma matogrossensis TaxID=162370 RepID=E2J7D2_9HEMI
MTKAESCLMLLTLMRTYAGSVQYIVIFIAFVRPDKEVHACIRVMNKYALLSAILDIVPLVDSRQCLLLCWPAVASLTLAQLRPSK